MSRAITVLKSKNPGSTEQMPGEISNLHIQYGKACGVCVQPFERTLDNIIGLEAYIHLPGAKDILRQLQSGQKQFQGADWILEILQQKKFKGTVSGFEVKYINDANYKVDILADYSEKGKNYKVFIDGKNWAAFLEQYEIHFVKQLAAYLSRAEKIEDVNYFFNAARYAAKKEDVIRALKSVEAREALKGLFENGKLQQLLPDEIISSVDDFIIELTNDNVFNKIFR